MMTITYYTPIPPHTPYMQSTNRQIYEGSIRDLAAGVTNGLNGTVFAYGSTGSGKTYTMVGEWS